MNDHNKKRDKSFLYLIIDLFLSNKMDEKIFCDEYYSSYDLEIDYSTLTSKESHFFSELSEVVSRFSEYPEDHGLDPKAFVDKEELRSKVIEVKNSLQNIDGSFF